MSKLRSPRTSVKMRVKLFGNAALPKGNYEAEEDDHAKQQNVDENEVLKLLNKDGAGKGALDRRSMATGTLKNLKKELAEHRNVFGGVRFHALQLGTLNPTQTYDLVNHQKFTLLRKHVSSLNRILDRVEVLFLSEHAGSGDAAHKAFLTENSEELNKTLDAPAGWKLELASAFNTMIVAL